MSISKSALTVVHVSSQKSWHGGEGQALQLARGLRQRGHRCVILAREGGEFAFRLSAEYFEVHTFRGRGRAPDSLWKIRRLLSSIQPDVIHSHDAHALTASGLAALGLNVPLRVASRRVDFSIRSALKFRRLADVVIPISTAVAEICRYGGIPDSMLEMVHSGVDPAWVQSGDRHRGRQRLGISGNRPLVVVVAKLTAHKGHEFLLDAMPAIVKRFPQLQLALVGDGELAESLRAQSIRLNLGSNINFLGYRADVPDLIMASDLFVMPSYMEGLCTSILDAMFARIPVVTTGAGGIADIVGADHPDGPFTYLGPPKDSQALAESILLALSDPAGSRVLAQKACRRAEAMFTHDHMVNGTLEVYWRSLTRQRTHAA
ncbi:MAG: glycosyltransferase family 4 protein [Planctomycetales bacterium]